MKIIQNIFVGKNLLKTNLLLELESGSRAVQSYGTQAVLTGTVRSPADVVSAVDSVTTADVRNVSKLDLMTLISIINLICCYRHYKKLAAN